MAEWKSLSYSDRMKSGNQKGVFWVWEGVTPVFTEDHLPYDEINSINKSLPLVLHYPTLTMQMGNVCTYRSAPRGRTSIYVCIIAKWRLCRSILPSSSGNPICSKKERNVAF